METLYVFMLFVVLIKADCVFPFQVNGVWYDTCTNLNSGSNFWCSLDQVYTNRRAFCAQSCSFLARRLTNNHSSCLRPASNASPYFPDASAISTILTLHNNARSVVNPSASDMRVISWDIGLSRLAQRRAENCQFAHDCANCRVLVNNRSISVGQNAYMAFFKPTNQVTFWTGVVKSWTDESVDFTYNQKGNLFRTEASGLWKMFE